MRARWHETVVWALLSALLFPLAVLWAADSSLAERDGDELEAVGTALLTELGAEPSGCPSLPHGFGPFHVAVCGRVDRALSDADRIREIVDRRLATSSPSVRPKPFEWQRQGKRHWRNSVVGLDRVSFGFNAKSGKMAFAYPLALPACLPESKRTPRPVFPEQALVARVGGMVVLEVEIDDQGRIGEVCVQESSRKGYGFEEAAIEAVRLRQYHPAELDGQVTASSMTVWTDFEIR